MWLREDKSLHDRRGADTATDVNLVSRPFDEGRVSPPIYSYALPFLVLAASLLLLISSPLILAENRTFIGTFWAAGLYILSTVAVVMLLRERTRRRDAERSLRVDKAEASMVEDYARLGSWSWESNNDCLRLSRTGRQLLGLGVDSAMGLKDFAKAFFREDRRDLEGKIANASRLGLPFTAEARIAGNGDVARWIQVSGVVVKEDDLSADSKCVGILVDATRRKLMELEIEAMRRELAHCVRGEILGGLSGALAHELKQPLAAILSNAQAAERMLQRNPIDVTELSDTIRDIIEDDSRAGAVIMHLRSLFKNDEKDWMILNVNQIVQDAMKIVNSSLLQRNVELVMKLSQTPLCVRGNRVQLQQVILNLVLNAAEAMGETGVPAKKLVVETRDNAVFATIAISDSGPGLPDEVKDRMFQPFFTTKAQGLGLGLSICRSIVAAHGGKLNAVSNANRGATFIVDLPVTHERAKWSKAKAQLSS